MTNTARLRDNLIEDIQTAQKTAMDNLKAGGDPEKAAAAASVVCDLTAALASLVTASRA